MEVDIMPVIHEEMPKAKHTEKEPVSPEKILRKIVDVYKEDGHDTEYCGHAVKHILR